MKPQKLSFSPLHEMSLKKTKQKTTKNTVPYAHMRKVRKNKTNKKQKMKIKK